MSSKRDVWTEFLNAINRDESKKEANLVILGIFCYYIHELRRKFEDVMSKHIEFALGYSRPIIYQEQGHRHYELHVHNGRLSKQEEYKWRWRFWVLLKCRLSGSDPNLYRHKRIKC